LLLLLLHSAQGILREAAMIFAALAAQILTADTKNGVPTPCCDDAAVVVVSHQRLAISN
jgi:hypothetical protein